MGNSFKTKFNKQLQTSYYCITINVVIMARLFTSSLLYMATAMEINPANIHMLRNDYQPNNFQDMKTQMALLNKSTFKIKKINAADINHIEIVNRDNNTFGQWSQAHSIHGEKKEEIMKKCTFYESGIYSCSPGVEIEIPGLGPIKLTVHSYHGHIGMLDNERVLSLYTVPNSVIDMPRFPLTLIRDDDVLTYSGPMRRTEMKVRFTTSMQRPNAILDLNSFINENKGLSMHEYEQKRKNILKHWALLAKKRRSTLKNVFTESQKGL